MQAHDVVLNKPFKSHVKKFLRDKKLANNNWVPSRFSLAASVRGGVDNVPTSFIETALRKWVFNDTVLNGTVPIIEASPTIAPRVRPLPKASTLDGMAALMQA